MEEVYPCHWEAAAEMSRRFQPLLACLLGLAVVIGRWAGRDGISRRM